MRKLPEFSNGQYYHVYNRGVEKRDIFQEATDSMRFLQSMKSFNTQVPVGSLYELSFKEKSNTSSGKKLVDIVAYCLNPNHFHLILKQRQNHGVSEFMKRVGGGYTCHINEKHQRIGPLFAGSYKVKHVSDNDHLLHLSAYVNLNFIVHNLKSPVIRSSWAEYESYPKFKICSTDIILNQFKGKKDYRKFAEDSIADTAEQRKKDKELEKLLME
jgi:putative transposase